MNKNVSIQNLEERERNIKTAEEEAAKDVKRYKELLELREREVENLSNELRKLQESNMEYSFKLD